MAERERWPLWLPVGFGTGIGLYFSLSIEPPAIMSILAGCAGVVVAFQSARSERIGLQVALAALAAISLGFSYAKWREVSVAAPVLSHKLGPAAFEGRIENVQIHGKGMRVVLGALRSRKFTE
ncbi:MAG TPA: hypothetical protein VHE09_10240, partial [Rhizomicrobium sp.]|nr:hypothetical protein [Rhizomicrobium sp.]